MDEYAKRGYLLENFRLFHLRTEKTAQVDFHYHEFCKSWIFIFTIAADTCTRLVYMEIAHYTG